MPQTALPLVPPGSAGKLAMRPEPFRLAATVADARDIVAEAAAAEGLAFTAQGADTLQPWVRGDARRLQQILVEPAVERDQVHRPRQRVAARGEQRRHRPLRRHRHRHRAHRGPDGAAVHAVRAGRPLGLAPPRRQRARAGHQPQPRAADGLRRRRDGHGPRRLAGLRLLVAEDDEVNRLILGDMLARHGAGAEFAENGERALAVFRAAGSAAFDAVLMNIQMPLMDGYEAARRVLQEAPGMPVIGQTAHALADDHARCLAAGTRDVVTKPIDSGRLVQAVPGCCGHAAAA